MRNPAFPRRIAAFLCAVFLIVSPVAAETVKGNGAIRTQTRAVSGFTGVGLGIRAHVEVRQGDAEGVTVEADENLLPLIETVVRHGSLEIKPVRRHLELDSRSIKLIVQARQLDNLAVGGSGDITADALRAGKLALEIGGSGLIDLKRVTADSIHVDIGGSGNVKLAGASKRLDVSIGGSGDVLAPAMVADQVGVEIAGSGAAQVAARSRLDVEIAGAGSVNYAGDPEVKQTIAGSGRVKRTGPLP